MNNLYKLLPIAIGIGAVSSGAVGGIVSNVQTTSVPEVNSSDPFVVWATAAKKDAQTNFAAILKVAPVADWKMSDHISLINVKTDIWNESVDIVLQDGSWGMRATISDAWSGQAYNINQWKCSVEPRDTNAHLTFENWYSGWNGFRKINAKTQVQLLVNYWYDHQLKGKDIDKSNSVIKDQYMDPSSLGLWNANISNIVLHGKTITATYHFFPLVCIYYFSINVTFTWNGAMVFNNTEIQPIGDWVATNY